MSTMLTNVVYKYAGMDMPIVTKDSVAGDNMGDSKVCCVKEIKL
jgi:hypothetical protein